MATQTPDTDEQKREPPGEISGIPEHDAGGGRPAGDPEQERPDNPDAPKTDPGYRPGGSHPGGSPNAKEGGAGNPATGGQSGAAQPRGDEPSRGG